MALAVHIALIVLSAVAGALLNVLLAPYIDPVPNALVAIAPTTIVAVLLAIQAFRHERVLRERIDGIEDHIGDPTERMFRRLDALSRRFRD